MPRRLLEISLLSNNNERNQQVRHIFGYYNLILTKKEAYGVAHSLLPFAKPPLFPTHLQVLAADFISSAIRKLLKTKRIKQMLDILPLKFHGPLK